MQGMDPYMIANQTRRGGMPSSLGYGSAYGRYGHSRLPILPDMSSQPSNAPQGSFAVGTGADARTEQGAEKMQQQEMQNREAVASQANQRTADTMNRQTASVDAYRRHRDQSQGTQDAREQTQIARDMGIDPSSSQKDIAASASGPVTFDENGMPTGGSSGQKLTSPTAPPPVSTPGAVQPTETDIRNQAVTAQAAKDGLQASQQGGAYATGYAGGNVPVTTPNTSGIEPSATPAMDVRPMQTPMQQPPAPKFPSIKPSAYGTTKRSTRPPRIVSPINANLRT